MSAIDWDRVVIESEDNGVVVYAGQVALLVGADADTVTWGHITGDITQQPDLMVELDSKIGVDSPTFTGTPRTPTPPAGNNSTRIASTAFVQGELNSKDAPSNGKTYGRRDHDWNQLGNLATQNTADYQTQLTNKPELGTLSKANEPGSSDPSFNIIWGRRNDFGSNPEWVELGPLAASKQHAVIYVNGLTGNDVNNTGTFNSPFKTIQHAVDISPMYFTVEIQVEAGNYDEAVEIVSKRIYLHQVGTGALIIRQIRLTNNSFLRMSGYINIAGHLLASDESLIIKTSDPLILSGGGGYINAEKGSVIKLLDGVTITVSLTTPLIAETGGTIIVGNVLAGDVSVRIGTLATAASGIVVFTKSPFVTYTRFKSESGGGCVIDCDFGTLANKDTADFWTDITNKPANTPETFGSLAKANEPSQNTSANVTKRWVRTNETVGGVASPAWEELDEPDDSITPTLYARTSFAVGSGSGIQYKHGWQLLGGSASSKYVDGVNGNDSTGSGSSSAPFKTIQHAIDVSPNFASTIIRVKSGTYNEDISVDFKNIEIQNWDSNNVVVDEIEVSNGTLELYGKFNITNLLRATNKSTIFCTGTITLNSAYAYIQATLGSVVKMFSSVTITADLYCPFRASVGGIVIIGNQTATSGQFAVTYFAEADNGIVIYTQTPSIYQLGNLKNESNGGRVFYLN